jgi:molybdopterin-binding protein
MDLLNVREAAEVLRLHPKRVQQLARAGQLPAVRVGRKWLFRRGDLERLLGTSLPRPTGPALDVSARNQLRGRVSAITVDGLMAGLVLKCGDQEVVAIFTRSSGERVGGTVGDEVFAVIKSTEVMVARGTAA